MKEHHYYVYMMTNKRNGTLYTGMTNDLVRRVYEHREGVIAGFTQRYGLKRLVWFECHTDVTEAITREKNIQAWKRAWKLKLIEQENSDWNDLYDAITGCQPMQA